MTAAVPSPLVEPHKGFVTPRGVDHVLLHVADLEKGARFYRILYGEEAIREKTPERVWFQIGDTKLGLEQAAAGQKPHIAHFGIKVAPLRPPHRQRRTDQAGREDCAVAGRSRRLAVHGPRRHLSGAERMTREAPPRTDEGIGSASLAQRLLAPPLAGRSSSC